MRLLCMVLLAAPVLLGPAPAQSALPPPATRLLAPPLLGRPTAGGIAVNVVFAGAPSALALEVQRPGRPWRPAPAPERLAADAVQWAVTGLEPGTRYLYRVLVDGEPRARGSFVTRRSPGSPFTFALLTDPHIFVRDFTPAELEASPLPPHVVARHASREDAVWVLRTWRAYGRALLPRVATLALGDHPDFVINLGDLIDLHGFGFNIPVPDARWARQGFLDYRRLLGPLGARAAHFTVMGNWDGEKGHFTDEERLRSRRMRLAYLPNPAPETYPEGGSPQRDYYAFTWGDALFVVLNVATYTPTEHLLDRKADPGRADDYTLGKPQLAWLERTLTAATARWRFLCIHHPVGGHGGDVRNSAYGRGGGRAARVGEQARVHALMKKHGVQALFYGHDHVFTDMVVDGIHYTLPGSCGAPWKFSRRETGYTRYWTDSGYARVRVNPERVEVTFINADRQLLYRYVLRAGVPGAARK